MSNLHSVRDFRFSLPETIWLEAEHFSLANQISSQERANTGDTWQVYLNMLSLLALEVWLDDRLTPSTGDSSPQPRVIYRDTSAITIAGSLTIGDYKFGAIATEHLLDEMVSIPQRLVEQPELIPHFYVLLEVLEEEEEVVIKGFVPYSQLIEIKDNIQLSVHNDCYQIPLSYFDSELNHLLAYCRYIEAAKFAVPATAVNQVSQVNKISENLAQLVSNSTTKLSQWLQGAIDEGWQTIESLANPELSLAFSTRSFEQDTKRAKIIDLGIDLGGTKFALLLNISPQASESIKVLVQLYPLEGENYLPQDTKLILLSKAGKTLQEVTARTQDNYIQLKPFKGESGKKFSIQVSLGDVSLKEDFEL